MQGKILGIGAISGSDGKRYTYEASELKNSTNEAITAGSEVDFEIAEDGNKAVNIYVVNTSDPTNAIRDSMLSNDIGSIKIKAFVALGFGILAALTSVTVVLPLIFGIISLVFFILVTLALKQRSRSTTLLSNVIKSVCAVIIGLIILAIAYAAGLGTYIGFGAIAGSGAMTGTAVAGVGVAIILGLIGLVVMFSSIYFSYLYCKEMAFITNQKLFMYAFFCYLGAEMLAALVITAILGLLLVIAALVMLIIAWINVKEIRTSYSAKALAA